MVRNKKFGLGIIVWENCDFLFYICKELRPIADNITICWQDVSYSGKVLDEETHSIMTSEINYLINIGLIDNVITYNNVCGTEGVENHQINERHKRRYTFDYFNYIGMDYCLIVDSDEFNLREDVERNLIESIENDYQVSYTRQKIYVLNTHIRINDANNPETLLNYIQNCHNYQNNFEKYATHVGNYVVDCTRSFGYDFVPVFIDTFAYHFAYIRKNLKQKLDYYSQPTAISNDVNCNLTEEQLIKSGKFNAIMQDCNVIVEYDNRLDRELTILDS